MDWFMKSIIPMILLVPFFLMIPFLHKNFGVRPETSTLMWFLGSVIGITVWSYVTNQNDIVSFKLGALFVLALGLTAGTMANIFMSQAIATAPNPGLVPAIINGNVVIIVILAPILGLLLPNYFDPARVTVLQRVGISSILIGLTCLALGNTAQ